MDPLSQAPLVIVVETLWRAAVLTKSCPLQALVEYTAASCRAPPMAHYHAEPSYIPEDLFANTTSLVQPLLWLQLFPRP